MQPMFLDLDLYLTVCSHCSCMCTDNSYYCFACLVWSGWFYGSWKAQFDCLLSQDFLLRFVFICQGRLVLSSASLYVNPYLSTCSQEWRWQSKKKENWEFLLHQGGDEDCMHNCGKFWDMSHYLLPVTLVHMVPFCW